MIRTALIGYGYAGKTFHAPLIEAEPELELALVVSSDAAKVALDRPDVEVVPDASAAFGRPDIDLVVIAAPNTVHAPLADAALRAGKHVVVDKPFTLTAEEARALRDLAGERGRLLSVFHNRRWDGDFLTLQRLLDQGTLGEVLAVESRFDRFRPEVRRRWREQDLPGSGLWYDLGPHLLDQALRLFGPPLAATGSAAVQRPGAETVDWFQVILDYGRRRVTVSASMLTAAPLPRFAVHGTAGSWIKHGLDPQEDQLKAGLRPGAPGWGVEAAPGRVYGADGVGHPLAGERGDYPVYYRGVARAIANGDSNPVPADEACAVMDILEAVAHHGAWRPA